MGLIIADRVQETSTTTGTGTMTLLGAVSGYQSFSSAMATGSTTYYCIQNQAVASEWEVGYGTLATATTLARTTVIASSNANAAVSFSAGTKNVFVTLAGVQSDVFPGMVKQYGGLTIPTGYLLCDGSAVSRTTYAALFAALSSTQAGSTTNASTSVTGLTDTSVLAVGFQVTGTGIATGTTVASIVNSTSITLSLAATATGSPSLTFTSWGKGDGSTTFNVPDLRGKAVIGDGTGSGLTARGLGQSGGEETHLLTIAEMPSHTHSAGNPLNTLAGGGAVPGGAQCNFNALTTGPAGGGGSHNNMQPFAVVKYIIKT